MRRGAVGAGGGPVRCARAGALVTVTESNLRRLRLPIDRCDDGRTDPAFLLRVREPGLPLVPWSFHATHAEAFTAGLLAVTGQAALALDPWPGWDFDIVKATPAP